jgi:hypothetical protein
MKVFVGKIHPTRNPSYCVLSGERDGGDLGFWAGPDIDVTGSQIVTPHVSRRMAKQWLEADGLVVDAEEHQRVLAKLAETEDELEKSQAAVKQLQNRLGRVFPGRKRTAKAVAA